MHIKAMKSLKDEQTAHAGRGSYHAVCHLDEVFANGCRENFQYKSLALFPA